MEATQPVPAAQADDLTARIVPTLDFARWRSHIERALEHSPGTHDLDDIRQGVASGAFQLWPSDDSAILTQVHVHPRRKLLCIYLAAGHLEELHAMLPRVLDWARDLGCDGAFIAGRPAWARTFLATEGWRPEAVILAKDL